MDNYLELRFRGVDSCDRESVEGSMNDVDVVLEVASLVRG